MPCRLSLLRLSRFLSSPACDLSMRRGGYYTLEATFIVSICIWVIFALCYTGFYVHDSLLLESGVNEHLASGRGDNAWEKNTKRELQKKMLLLRIRQVKVKKQLTSVKVKVNYTLPVSWKKLKRMFLGSQSQQVYEAERETVKASHYRWDCDILKGKRNSGK